MFGRNAIWTSRFVFMECQFTVNRDRYLVFVQCCTTVYRQLFLEGWLVFSLILKYDSST
jgi:hypothetical protein